MTLANDHQIRAGSKTGFVEQVNLYLHTGNYSRALDLLRGITAEFPNDAELSALHRFAQDGVNRGAAAQRLITESQELFAVQKPAEALQVLRKAYELDKNNSLARSILANALVEHARSVAESDWLEAEKLTNQALSLNPAHPTAKTVLSLIVDLKTTSSVEDWVSQAQKLQSSGDLFGALAWVAEGLAVHPHDPKLLQIQGSIQRDQNIQRRHVRRRDLEDLRVMEAEIDRAVDAASKQALVERIQGLAAKYWTDGAILTVANSLLQRLGGSPLGSSKASSHAKSATVIFHVPRPSMPKPVPGAADSIPLGKVSHSVIPANKAATGALLSGDIPTASVLSGPVFPSQAVLTKVAPHEDPGSKVVLSQVPSSTVSSSQAVPKGKTLAPVREPQPEVSPQQAEAERSAPALRITSSSRPEPSRRTNLTSMILVAAFAAIIAAAATLFFARKHYTSPVAKTPSVTASATPGSAPAAPASDSIPVASASAQTIPAQSVPELPAVRPSDDQPSNESAHNLGSLLVIAGQDNAQVLLNGKPQRQLTQAGQLRITNLELKDYDVKVSKSGFQDPPPQVIRVRKGQQARLVFSLQPQPRLASLAIQGGVPGTTVLVDQSPVGTIQADGTLSVSAVNPGDHTVELRKDRFTPRLLKEHFVAGSPISLAAADAALEAAPGELKITFTPADAKVALVKGEHLTLVSSGVPLNLIAGTYTLTARTTDGIRSSSTLEVIAGQSKALNFSLAPNGMSKWDDPSAWKQDKDSFLRKGGDFVLYGAVPASGTFVFSAAPAKSHVLQWVVNYSDPRNYVLFQLDDNHFCRTVIRNGQKTDETKLPDKGDKKTLRTVRIHISSNEIVNEINTGNKWIVLDRWTQPGANLSAGKFGLYIPGNDQVELSNFSHYPDLTLR